MNNKSDENESQPEKKNVLFKTTIGAALSSKQALIKTDEENVETKYQHASSIPATSEKDSQSELVTGAHFLKLDTAAKMVLTDRLWKKTFDHKESALLSFIGSSIGLNLLKANFERGELTKFCSEEENDISRRSFYKYAQVGEVFKDMPSYAHVGTHKISEMIRICDLEEVARNVIFKHKLRFTNRQLERLKSNYKKVVGTEKDETKVLNFLTRFRDKSGKKKQSNTNCEIDLVGDFDWPESADNSTSGESPNVKGKGGKEEKTAVVVSNESPSGEKSSINIVADNLLKLAPVANIISSICAALKKEVYDSDTRTSVASVCTPLKNKLDEAISLALVGEEK